MPTYSIPNANAMHKFGQRCAGKLTGGDIVFLRGQLGAGKTTLAGGIIHSLGVSEPVVSPTYTLVEYYETDKYKIYHIDLYRLTLPHEIETIGLRDMLTPAAIILIEWPERAYNLLPTPQLDVEIIDSDHIRQVKLYTADNKNWVD